MHPTAIAHMQDCVGRFLSKDTGLVLDVGSRLGPELATSRLIPEHRIIFETAGWKYHGLDLEKGNNVDIVAEDPFDWPIESNIYDAVISGQMLEHNSMFWMTALEMVRVLKPGGHMIHVAPSRGPEHRAPQDCWRFYRDGMKAIADWTDIKILETTTDWSTSDFKIMTTRKKRPVRGLKVDPEAARGRWGDTVGVFQKPLEWTPKTAMRHMETQLRKLG